MRTYTFQVTITDDEENPNLKKFIEDLNGDSGCDILTEKVQKALGTSDLLIESDVVLTKFKDEPKFQE